MSSNVHDPAQVREYHAHVYFMPETRTGAEHLRDQLGQRFDVRLGRWHDQPIGPHTRGMYQVLFAAELFATLVPWLMLNRRGLSVLVHPETGDDVGDHADRPLWLGAPQVLDIEFLRRIVQ